MNNTYHEFQIESVKNGQQSLIENIKILLYQYDSLIFDKIDFDDDKIFQEPLLYSFFSTRNQSNINLESILYGYTKPNLRTLSIEVTSDESGRIYLPNIGWLKTKKYNTNFSLSANKSQHLLLLENYEIVEYVYENLQKIDNTNVEIIKYPIPLLEQFYFDVNKEKLTVEIENIYKVHKTNITIAWNLIKDYAPNHFKVIELVTTKCVIFNIEKSQKNSFATLSAQGIAFFNAYQDEYNEVFFIDDIAHQTGHLIFNTFIYDFEKFLLVKANTKMERIELGNNRSEERDIHTLFHALYTYYSTFICLNACLEANVLVGFKRHEALGRIKFYLLKCHADIMLIERPLNKLKGPNEIFTSEGMKIYDEIKKVYNEMFERWNYVTVSLDFKIHPYNFTYSKFLEVNPLTND